MSKELKVSLKAVKMVRCEVTGKLYPASECEVVVIKIVKWKNADINDINPFSSRTNNAPKEAIYVAKTEDFPINTPNMIGPSPDSPEFNKIIHRKLSAIPPSMKDIFNKPPELL